MSQKQKIDLIEARMHRLESHVTLLESMLLKLDAAVSGLRPHGATDAAAPATQQQRLDDDAVSVAADDAVRVGPIGQHSAPAEVADVAAAAATMMARRRTLI